MKNPAKQPRTIPAEWKAIGNFGYKVSVVALLFVLLFDLHRIGDKFDTPQPEQVPPVAVNHHPSVVLGGHLVTRLEGLRLDPYYDPSGYPTVCYGHLLSTKKHEPLHQFESRTHEECVDLLHSDLADVHHEVDQAVTHPLNAHQKGAIISFVYNVGEGAFLRSTLLRDINDGELVEVPVELRRWVHAGDNVVQGLVLRREEEIKMWHGTFQ